MLVIHIHVSELLKLLKVVHFDLSHDCLENKVGNGDLPWRGEEPFATLSECKELCRVMGLGTYKLPILRATLGALLSQIGFTLLSDFRE